MTCITDLQWHIIVLYVMENLILDKPCTDHVKARTRVNHAVDLTGVRGRHSGGGFGRDAVADVEYGCMRFPATKASLSLPEAGDH
jgi:hypothetical protein